MKRSILLLMLCLIALTSVILTALGQDETSINVPTQQATLPDDSQSDLSLKSATAGPNLIPYKPSTWDNVLVVSSNTGTSTTTSPIFNNQTLYVDWAVINNSTVAITQTFYSKLYVDGVLSGTWYTSGLGAGAWAYKLDHDIGKLTPGSHTIRIETDVTGVVTESNESDNYYSRTITVYPYVNLTTYKPSGWDDKIVLSTVTGTNTTTSQILSTDNIYLDWSVANVSAQNTTTSFYIDLYIDGTWKAAWSRSGLNASNFTTQLDYLVGKLAPGTHTFMIKVDMDNYVPEYNETDNEYTRTITVYNKNLLLYQRAGWDNKLVLSTVTGTNTSAPAFYNNQDIYVDWSVWNNGTAAIPETFHSKLYVDGVLKNTWVTYGLAANYTAYVADCNIGKLTTGNHTVRIVVDSNGEVAESNESDNSFTRTIYVGPSYNLTPYQPGGWDNKLVLSTVTGTNTSASVFYDTQTIYVDWGCLNNGNDDFAGTFYIRLYVDDVARGTWTKTGLAHNTYTFGLDGAVGPLSAGTHTFKLVIDSDGHVAESDETDNIYTRTITVVNKNLLPYQPAGWDNMIVLSAVSGTNTSVTTICENQPIYLDYAIRNSGSAAITETFYVRLYIDGVVKATWTKAGLGANTYYTIQDYNIGILPAGSHTFKITADVLNNVNETSETDNEYIRTFSVSTCKNLTPHQPGGWDNKIVLSTVTGTNTSATTIYDNQPVYLDWSIISNGTNNITETFNTKLYIDGSLKATWTKAGLNAGVYLYYADYNVGMLPSGNHTFRIVADADNNVVETSEADNQYSRTITILPAIPPEPVAIAATSITLTGFNANWNAATGAAAYYLDVSTSSTFASFVSGYNNKNTGNVLTYPVTGLIPGTQYYYRVRAANTSGNSSSSNTIEVKTYPLYNPQVLYPSAPGIVWNPGTIYEITWQDFSDPYVKIELLKGGSSVRTITTSTANDGNMLWKVASLPSGNDYKIRITSTATPAMTDVSDNNFTIQPLSNPVVTYPSATDIVWNPGTIYEITWQDFTDPYVRIELLKGSAVVRTITTATANDGSMLWKVAQLTPGNDYRIRITSTATPAMSDISDNLFAIQPAASPMVTYPSAAGIVWVPGTIYEIKWENYTDPYVRIELLKGGTVVRTVASSRANSGSMLWRAPALESGNDYRIRVTSTATPAMTDESDNNFRLSGPPQVTYPSAAGIVWEPGTIYEITWQDFTDPYVKIELLKGGSVVRTVTTSTPNDGTMLWRAPAITPGNDYKIQITSTATPAMTDLSDNNFSISGAKSATIAGNDPGWNDLMIYPNPFTDRVTIGYSIAEKGRTLIEVFDLTGRRVSILQDAMQKAGTYELQWDATDASGQQVISGIYLCRIQSGGFVKTEKLVFNR
jgi:subtilase family serine protease